MIAGEWVVVFLNTRSVAILEHQVLVGLLVLMALLRRCIRLRTLAGDERRMWVDDAETLGSVTPRILQVYNRSLHQLRLLSDETTVLIEHKDEQPFKNGHSEFTVIFWWESTWSHRIHGSLLAIKNEPHLVGWPQVGVDKQYAGSFSYSSPYTRERWFDGYGACLHEILLNLLSEKSSTAAPGNLHDLERISKVACRISQQHARLSVCILRDLLAIAQQAASRRLTPFERLAIQNLDLFLRCNGLKDSARRCRRKTTPAPLRRRVEIYNRVVKRRAAR